MAAAAALTISSITEDGNAQHRRQFTAHTPDMHDSRGAENIGQGTYIHTMLGRAPVLLVNTRALSLSCRSHDKMPVIASGQLQYASLADVPAPARRRAWPGNTRTRQLGALLR